jgi:hypothetical protein
MEHLQQKSETIGHSQIANLSGIDLADAIFSEHGYAPTGTKAPERMEATTNPPLILAFPDNHMRRTIRGSHVALVLQRNYELALENRLDMVKWSRNFSTR